MRFQATSTSFEELLEGFDQIIPGAEKELHQKGFGGQTEAPPLPFGIDHALLGQENNVPLIKDVTDLSSDQMTKLFTYYTNWANYAEKVSTDWKLEHNIADRKRKVIESTLKVHYHDAEKRKATMCMDYVRQDVRWRTAEMLCASFEVRYKRAELQMNTCRRMIRLISREQSRRGELLEMESQENRLDTSDRWKKKF